MSNDRAEKWMAEYREHAPAGWTSEATGPDVVQTRGPTGLYRMNWTIANRPAKEAAAMDARVATGPKG